MNLKDKIDAGKLISVAAAVVGIAGTLLTGLSQKKSMEEAVAKEVAKAMVKTQDQN